MIRIEINTTTVEEAQTELARLLAGGTFRRLADDEARVAGPGGAGSLTDGQRQALDRVAHPEPPVPVLGTEPVAAAAPQPEQPTPAESAPPDAQPARKRGRPPKAKDVPAAPANPPEPADGAGVSVPADPSPAAPAEPSSKTTTSSETGGDAGAAAPSGDAPTLDDVKATVLALSKAIDYRTAVDMIQQMFGVSAIRDIPPDRYADAIAEARRRMAAAEEKAVADILG